MPPKKNKDNQSHQSDNTFTDLFVLKNEITKLTENITTKFSTVETSLIELKQGQSELTKALDFFSSKFDELNKTVHDLKSENRELKKDNGVLKDRVGGLETRLNELDQYHRRVNLEIAGVPEVQGENVKEIVAKVIQHVAPNHANVSPTDIDVCHRMGKKSEAAGNPPPRAIIVRFTTRRARDAVYEGKKKLKSMTSRDLGCREERKVYINENLLPSTKVLLSRANAIRKREGYRYLWTWNTKILVRKTETSPPLVIASEEDLLKIK